MAPCSFVAVIVGKSRLNFKKLTRTISTETEEELYDLLQTRTCLWVQFTFKTHVPLKKNSEYIAKKNQDQL